MGSGQSVPANESGSFSIDPSGNISPTKKRPNQADNDNNINSSSNIRNDNNDNKQSATMNSGVGQTPTGFNSDDNNAGQARQQTLATLDSMPKKQTNAADRLDLNEANEIVSRMKTKYKPNSGEMAGKNASVFEDVEKNLIHCYKTNKNQPLNCLKLSHEYNDYVREQRDQILKRSINTPLITTIVMIVTCIILHLTAVHCFGAMSVDLGSEYMKVGLVAPSIPMDIVLNPQSQRKTAMAIAFSNGERFVGDPALDVASKYPDRTYTHFLDLVGKTIQDESVEHYKKRFPYADIVSHEPNSTSIVLNHPEGLKFTPLELISMMLQHAHDQVVTLMNSNEPANDVVITVPPFFNEVEKRVIRDAAKLAGLNVLRLTNVNSAFALYYGIFRHKDYLPESSDNRTSIIFVDQGASHTSVTLADYHLVEQIDEVTYASKNESLPTITIRAQVYDRYLGGFDMQLRLRDHLVKDFAKKTNIDETRIYKRGRSASKLLKEAGRVKRVLSANTDHLVRVENVIYDKDLRQPIKREEFEQMNQDLLTTRITSLLDRLYEHPEVSKDDRIESVIIVGGNTRTPKIQQVLLDYFKLENLGKSVNADEGAALAALYQAASMGRGFRVKKFVLEEVNEERIRFDPAKVVTTTTTTTPAPTTADPSASTENPTESVEATTTAASTTTTTETPTTTPDPNAIYSQSELKRIGDKLAHLKEQDFLRLQRLSLRNSLESLLSDGREKLNNEDEKIKEKREEIEKIIRETYDWLEEGPMEERDNVTLLADKYTAIYDLVNPRPPPTLPPPPAFDPSSVDLSSFLNNDTLNILSKLNFSNPFASSSAENETDQVESASSGANDTSQQQDEPSKVIPDSVENGPTHTEL